MADTPDFVNGEPAPKKNDGPSMHDLVIADITGHSLAPVRVSDATKAQMVDYIRLRKKYGLEKYGTILQANNGRNSRRDALEEVVDLICYLKQMIIEFPDDGHAKLAYEYALRTYAYLIKTAALHAEITYVIGA